MAIENSAEQLCGQRIKECIEEAGETPTELAKLLGVNRATVYRWINGSTSNMKTTMISALARRYEVSPSWLMGYDVPKYPETESHANKRNLISDMLINVKESDLDRLLVIVKAFVDIAKAEEENERNEKRRKEGGANRSK